MAEIIWADWQHQHITEEHGVQAEDFDEAWHDSARVDEEELMHEVHGPYTLSFGIARGRVLCMVWRWQADSDEVWPITAYFVPKRGRRRTVRRRK